MAKDPQDNHNEQQSRLDDMIEVLRDQNATAKAAEETAELTRKINLVQSREGKNLSEDQKQALEGLTDVLSTNKLQDLETQRENNKRAEDTLDLLGDIAKNTEELSFGEAFQDSPFLATLAGLGIAFGTGINAVEGFSQGIKDTLGKQKQFLRGVGLGFIPNALDKFKAFFGNLFTKIGDGIKKLGSSFSASNLIKSLSDGLKSFTDGVKQGFNRGLNNATIKGQQSFKEFSKSTLNSFTKFISSIGRFIGDTFSFIIGTRSPEDAAKGQKAKLNEAVRGLFRLITVPLEATVKGIGNLAGIKKLQTLGDAIRGTFRGLTEGVGKIFRLLGRVFYPLTIIFGAIDGFKNAADQVEKQSNMFTKGIGAIGGFITGFVATFLGFLLDIPIVITRFIDKKLFGGAITNALGLDNISFVSTFKFIGNSITNFITGIADFIVDLFSVGPSQAFQNVATKIKNFTKILLKAILPDQDFNAPLFSPAGAARRAIPNSLYEYAGINVPEQTDIQPVDETGAELEQNTRNLNTRRQQVMSNQAQIISAPTNTVASSQNQNVYISSDRKRTNTRNRNR